MLKDGDRVEGNLCNIERCSFECRETKTKVITLANHRQTNQGTNENSKELHVAGAKHGNTNESESGLVLILLLIR